jgi:hypothetical protein
MEQLPDQFTEDPALKAALRRALDQESAPAALRNRILALRAGPAAETAEPPRSLKLPQRSPLFRFAVAAVLLIGFGALGYRIWQINQPPATYNPLAAIPQALYQEMVKVHAARSAQTTPDEVSTFADAAKLGQSIQRPVFVADLTRDGWTFQGAAVRKLGSDMAAQLYFTKGKEAISVFSLPASAAPAARDDQDYDKVFNGSPIAGFTHGKGLYCIVGSSPDDSLPVAEVKRLLAEHRGEIAKG